ncbi:hypothetical protein Vadar_019763 [Vaccinium darrowii]|uniref:Uncharacterized protein n=1 Tax=Vaccinium darrowii TaxID=229202 RepID=A0ACB7ZL24_9ERIC|nr:hypothetical protein Vadar_019763 [Vaccinium darrowii]
METKYGVDLEECFTTKSSVLFLGSIPRSNQNIRFGPRKGYISAAVVKTGAAILVSPLIAIQKSNSYHKKGLEASCEYGDIVYNYMLLFGAVQIVVSQIPDFHSIAWLFIICGNHVLLLHFYWIGTWRWSAYWKYEEEGGMAGLGGDADAHPYVCFTINLV